MRMTSSKSSSINKNLLGSWRVSGGCRQSKCHEWDKLLSPRCDTPEGRVDRLRLDRFDEGLQTFELIATELDKHQRHALGLSSPDDPLDRNRRLAVGPG